MHKRTPIGKFIHSSWSNMNIRCGKYKHLQTKNKCKSYENISIEFSREEYKEWCYSNINTILTLNRPSLDRINSDKNYKLDNIRVIELIENIRLKRAGSRYLNGPLSNTYRGIRKTNSNRFSTRITINNVEKHLGTYDTEEQAIEVFKSEYLKHYNKLPF